MERLWKYLENQFLNVTRDNYKKAFIISNYHDARLKVMQNTEPLLGPIYDRYHPLNTELSKEFSLWNSASGNRKGETQNLDQLLDDEYDRMDEWDVAVQATNSSFMKGSVNYKKIWYDGRKPFNNGSIDTRINAYATLAENMKQFSELNAIRAKVEASYTTLDAARDAQEGAKGDVITNSGKLENARVEAMNMMYRNLGFSMDNFSTLPDYIESMFDLESIRERLQSKYTATLAPLENKALLTHTFLESDNLKLKSNGNAVLHFHLSNVPNGINPTVVSVEANVERIISIADFAVPDLFTYRYLTVVNKSTTDSTQCIVELL